MTDNRSLVWGGIGAGGGMTRPPYWQDGVRTYHAMMLNAMWLREKNISVGNVGSFIPTCSIIPTRHPSYNGLLAPSNPSGTTLRMASGAALVDRFLYLNDSNIDFDCSTPGYYTLVIRAQDGTGGSVPNPKTCLATLIGPQLYTYPPPVSNIFHNGFIVDIVIAAVYSNGTTLQITDQRTFFRNLIVTVRKGGSTDSFGTAGSNVYVCDNINIQFGSSYLSSQFTAISFPEGYDWLDPYTYGNTPVVFAVPFGTPTAPFVAITSVSGTSFTCYASTTSGITKMFWVSIGGTMTRTPYTGEFVI